MTTYNTQGNLPENCNEALKTWDMKKLFADLDKRDRILNPNRNGLRDCDKQYICLLLSGKEPKQIAEQSFITIEALRVRLSTRGGLYDCIERLTGGSINNWRDVIILLLNKGYRKTESSHIPEETLLLMTIAQEVSEEMLRQLEEGIKEKIGVKTLNIKRIDKGSIIIVWQGSQIACQQIENLYRAGRLSEILGVPVLDVRVESSQESANLSQWFENIFTAGWQRVEELLTTKQLSPAVFSEPVKRAKLINLQADLISHTITLLINLTREVENKTTMRIKVYPTGDTNYLPTDLKLQILEGETEVFEEAISRSTDEWIQCEFDAQTGDKFSVRLALGEAVVTEHFVV